MQFDLLDIILSLGIVQGFFLSFAIVKIDNKNKSANRVLVLILITAALMLIGRTVYGHHLTINTMKWLCFADTIIYIFGPLCYLYFKRLIIQSEVKHRLSFYHYLPAIIHFVAFHYLLLIKDEAYINLYEDGSMNLIFNIVEFSGLSSNFFYLTKNFLLFKRYRKQEKNELAYSQDFLKFLLLFLICVAVSLLFWLFSYISYYYFGTSFTYVSYHIIWISIPIFIYVIGYFSLKQPEILRISPKSRKKTLVKRLSDQETLTLKKNVEEILSEQKTYLSSDLTLTDLARKVNTTSNDLSWLLNNVYKSNFYDFINLYRVNDFLKRIEKNEHEKYTLLFIAMEVGFKSKSTFNKVFKQHMAMTPSQYINSANNSLN